MITLNEHLITPTMFPDKTSQVWKINQSESANVIFDFEFEAEIIHLLQLVQLLNKQSVPVNLHMPYLPYARQDKEICNEFTFALHTFAAMLNVVEFNSITAIDVHSDEATRLIKGLVSLSARPFIRNALIELKGLANIG